MTTNDEGPGLYPTEPQVNGSCVNVRLLMVADLDDGIVDSSSGRRGGSEPGGQWCGCSTKVMLFLLS